LNRKDRRNLDKALRSGKAYAKGTKTVKLIDGPMGGWMVKPDAPVLQPGWLPPDHPEGEPPTHAYKLAPNHTTARWKLLLPR